MDILDRLQRKFGRYAVPNLMLYIIILNAAGFLIYQVNPRMLAYLCWDFNAILHGQVWRLVTFIMYPFSASFLSFVLFAFVYYSIGSALERTWGVFRFNLYIYTGLLGHIAGAILVYLCFGINTYMLNTGYLNTSLFLALAMTYPEMQFYLMFLIPIKAKWMAFVSIAYLVVSLITGSASTRVMIVMSLLNFILFAALMFKNSRFNPKDFGRRMEFRQKMRGPAARPQRQVHKCTVCGRTDAEYPDLEFRYCSKCAGAHEYCMEHLYTHIHIVKGD